MGIGSLALEWPESGGRAKGLRTLLCAARAVQGSGHLAVTQGLRMPVAGRGQGDGMPAGDPGTGLGRYNTRGQVPAHPEGSLEGTGWGRMEGLRWPQGTRETPTLMSGRREGPQQCHSRQRSAGLQSWLDFTDAQFRPSAQ